MRLTLAEYHAEKKPPAPAYREPLPRKRQRITARGRSGKPRRLTEEEVFLYLCQLASKELGWDLPCALNH